MTDKVTVVYDNECPFCRSYCAKVRIDEAAGELELIDAREPSPVMDEITSMGLDIDQGMVVKIGDQIHYGSDAIHILALMSTRSGFFNKINFWIFKSKTLSRILYPVLRSCRNLALWLLGIKFIRNLENADQAEKTDLKDDP